MLVRISLGVAICVIIIHLAGAHPYHRCHRRGGQCMSKSSCTGKVLGRRRRSGCSEPDVCCKPAVECDPENCMSRKACENDQAGKVVKGSCANANEICCKQGVKKCRFGRCWSRSYCEDILGGSVVPGRCNRIRGLCCKPGCPTEFTCKAQSDCVAPNVRKDDNYHCNAEGTVCCKIQCPVLNLGSLIIVSSNGTNVGTRVNTTCIPGYRVGFGDILRTCGADGKWTGQNVICNEILCESLVLGPNVDVSSNGTQVGTQVNTTCKAGYTKTGGDDVRTCDADGKWTGKNITCEEILCESLALGSNVDVSSNGTQVGTQVNTTCKAGYRKTGGDDVRTCAADGKWTGKNITCEENIQADIALLNKPTGQSSTYSRGESSRAVDGNRSSKRFVDFSCSITNSGTSNYWYVDLQKEYKITTVKIYARAEGFGYRFNNWDLIITSSLPPAGFAASAGGQVCHSQRSPSTDGQIYTISCNGMIGRYVGLEKIADTSNLEICEFEVEGKEV